MKKELNSEEVCCTKKKMNPGDTNDKKKDTRSAKGLCVNCDDVEICKFAGFGDEVIFCEEHSSNFENEHNDKPSHRFLLNVPNIGIKNLIP